MSSSSLAELLAEVVRQRDPTGWAVAAVDAAAEAPSLEALALPYTMAARKLQQAGAGSSTEHVARLEHVGAQALAAHGPVCMFRALLLLVTCGGVTEETARELVDELFRSGDVDERVALLCTLPYLPAPESHLATAVEACRSNVRDVFVAIACDNDYPARYFPDAAFNQMVMKALFSGVELALVRALSSRLNPELRRMARDYAAERRAAGRSIPSDIALAMGEGLFA